MICAFTSSHVRIGIENSEVNESKSSPVTNAQAFPTSELSFGSHVGTIGLILLSHQVRFVDRLLLNGILDTKAFE